MVFSRATLAPIKFILYISDRMIWFFALKCYYNYAILMCISNLLMITTKYLPWPTGHTWVGIYFPLEPGIIALAPLLSVPQPHWPPICVSNVPLFYFWIRSCIPLSRMLSYFFIWVHSILPSDFMSSVTCPKKPFQSPVWIKILLHTLTDTFLFNLKQNTV